MEIIDIQSSSRKIDMKRSADGIIPKSKLCQISGSTHILNYENCESCAECSFQFCSDCIQNHLKENVNICDIVNPENEIDYHIYQKGKVSLIMREEISEIKIKCINQNCNEIIPFKDLKSHEEVLCEFKKIKCQYCHLHYDNDEQFESHDCYFNLIKENHEDIYASKQKLQIQINRLNNKIIDEKAEIKELKNIIENILKEVLKKEPNIELKKELREKLENVLREDRIIKNHKINTRRNKIIEDSYSEHSIEEVNETISVSSFDKDKEINNNNILHENKYFEIIENKKIITKEVISTFLIPKLHPHKILIGTLKGKIYLHDYITNIKTYERNIHTQAIRSILDLGSDNMFLSAGEHMKIKL